MTGEMILKIRPNKAANFFFIALISLWVTFDLYRSTTGIMQGDSGIYFTFCKNFFEQPFSYSSGRVSYGATSPLFCFLISIIYHMTGASWFFALKLFSVALVVASAVICNCTIKGNAVTYLGIAAALCACRSYIAYSAAVFETGLVGFSVALCCFLLMRKRLVAAIYLSGLLYLIRPELALVTAGINLLILAWEGNKRKNFAHMIASAAPSLLYTVYMSLETGNVLPSSITGRMINASDDGYSFREKMLWCKYYLQMEYTDIIKWSFFFVLICIFMRVMFKWKKKYLYLITMAGLILLPHVLMPSVHYVVRYTIGVIPIALIAIGYAIRLILDRSGALQSMMVFFLCAAALSSNLNAFKSEHGEAYSQEKFDVLFGRDLQERLAEIGIVDGTVLMYEIQQQYGLEDFRGISLDAIVGSEMLAYLNRKQTLAEVVAQEDVDYIVCHSSALYRRVFHDTEIQELYRRGMEIAVGDVVEIDGARYRKILENEAAVKPYQPGGAPDIPVDVLWVYGSGEPWEGGWLFWQMVYEVLK